MREFHKKVSGSVLVRVLNGLSEQMNEDDRKAFCQCVSHTKEGLQAQLNEYKEKEWWSAAKKRVSALKDLEKIQNCQ